MGNRIYNEVGALRPGKSAFDLSHVRIFDTDIGRLTPVLLEDVIPGDIFEISQASVIRMQPMVAPLYHSIKMYTHYFFVPYRIIDKNFTKFATGGVDGDLSVTLPYFGDGVTLQGQDDFGVPRYSLWDYFGFPISDLMTGAPASTMNLSTVGHEIGKYTDVLDYPWRAYWAIWRDYYRDSNHQLYYPDGGNHEYEVGESDEEMLENLDTWIKSCGYVVTEDQYANIPAYRCWAKDYFTSALPWQQRGTSPAIPLSGSPAVHWPTEYWDTFPTPPFSDGYPIYFPHSGTAPDAPAYTLAGNATTNARNWMNNLNEFAAGAGIDIADLRYAFQVQKWMERSARGGYRYNEYLQAHYGVAPTDERLQRPEYIGGCYQPIITSEVLQTSETTATSPQGTMAGHGMSVATEFAGKYYVKEHGLIMGIMSIMPEAIYQQGIPRQWLKQTRFDMYSPEFAHLSEQEIKRAEIFWLNMITNDNIRFGFQGAFDEYRQRNSIVCGQIAKDLNVWTLSRIFTGPPTLNDDFLTTEQLSKSRRDAWAVSKVADQLQGEFLIQWRNIIKAIRPLPYMPEPGLVDHF